MYRQLKELTEEKKVLILGYGREGKSTYNVLKNIDCTIGIADKNDVRFDENVKFHIGDDYQKSIYDYDVVFKSPGIVLNDEKNVIDKITSQTDQMIKRYKNQIIGITGTKGKSTVTTLIYHILKNVRGNCILMGNIGIPAFDMIDSINDESILVYELSCHQLEYAPYSPHISVLLNIYEEHLDHYGTFERYENAKKNIYSNQCPNDYLICNYKNAPDRIYSDGRLITASDDNNTRSDIYVSDKSVFIDGIEYNHSVFKSQLQGRHNIYNTAIAYKACNILGIELDDFLLHLKNYVPLPHRLEMIGIVDDIKYYDDSISTISETTIQALKSLNDISTLIIGGMDRGICYRPLVEFLMGYELDNIIFMYDTGKKIYDIIIKNYKKEYKNKYLVVAEDLEQAVKLAKDITEKGKACLLSPAAASYGFFKNFEERGDKFKEYVYK